MRFLFMTILLSVFMLGVTKAQLVTIDADVDAKWEEMTGYMPMIDLIGGDAVADDISATVKTMWDEDAIYILVDVTDDQLDNAATATWERDQIEIYFDLGNEKVDADNGYDANDKQLSFQWNADNSAVLEGVTSAQKDTDKGWILEVMVPYSSIADFTPAEGTVIGFDVHVADNDGETARESKIALMTTVDMAWTNPSYMGELTLLAGNATKPAIDEFAAIPGYVPGIDLIGDDAVAEDISAVVKTKWDADNIYLQINVTDDVLDNAATNSWERDQIEIYFDLGNEKVDADNGYDENDKQLSFLWNTDNSAVLEGVSSTQKDTKNGWLLEVTVPWSTIMVDFVAAEGTQIGFDVHVADNDGEDARESKIALMATADMAWTNPSYMGTLTLEADGMATPSIDPWVYVTKYQPTIDVVDGDATPEDISAKVQTTWTTESMTIRVDITDDVLDDAAPNTWDRDAIELYFDLGNEKVDGSYDENDKQLTFLWNADNSAVLEGVTSTQEVTDNGWFIEVIVPYATIMEGFVPEVGTEIGFDVHVADNDGTDTKESKITIMTLEDQAWANPSYMGSLTFAADGQVELEIPVIEEPTPIAELVFDPATYDVSTLPEGMEIVEIDGVSYLKVTLAGWGTTLPVEDFAAAAGDEFIMDVKYEVGTSGFELSGINTFLKFSEGDAELVASGSASSADFAEYKLTIATAGNINVFQMAGQETTGWSAVEGDFLYIGAISKVIKAAPITFIVDDSEGKTHTALAIKGSWLAATGEYDEAWDGGAELAVFYDDGTNGDETAGDNIWTVTLDLVVDGGANTWEWGVNDADGNWIDGNFQFSVADASAQTLDAFVIASSVETNEAAEISVYPNPANGMFNIVNAANVSKVSLYSVSGQKVLELVNNGANEVAIDAASVPAGIYIVNIVSEGNVTSQKIVIE